MKQQRKGDRYKRLRIWVGLVLLAMCVGIGQESLAAQKRNVKVAFFPMDGYHNMREDGSFGGMDVEYLNVLCDYVNWNVEYVECDSWGTALEMLENKEVDLVGSAQYSSERAEIFQYADISSGYTFGVIATNPQSNIAYEDFHAMQDITFGMVENYVRKQEFLEYLYHNGIDAPQIVEYNSTADMHAALDSGEVDAYVHTFTEVKEGQRLVGRFAPRPFYYITYKGNDEVMRELNQAIVDLKMNQPELETELMNEFYYNKFDKDVLLTTEEKSYLVEKGTLTVAYLDNYYPFTYVKEDDFRGLTRELLESGLSITGLKLEYKLYANAKDAMLAVQEKEADIFAYSNEKSDVLNGYDLKSVCDYTEIPLVVIMDKSDDINEINVIATVSQLEDRAKAATLDDNVEVMVYETQTDCMDALAEGDVDAVLCNGYLAEHLMRTSVSYNNLQVKNIVDAEYQISIAVHETDALLANILEKTISIVDSKMVNEYLLRENTYPLVSITEFIKNNSLVIIAILIMIMVVVVIVVAHMLADSKKIQKLMYKDTKMDIWNLNYLTYWGEHKLLPEQKKKYVLVFLNLSKFRRYNIIYGWNAGEHLLESIADVLVQHVDKSTEICARSQGDRFVLLMQYQEEDLFIGRIKSIKNKVENRIQKETGDHMQLQLGVYFIPQGEIDIRRGMNFANQALEFVDGKKDDGIKVYDDSLQILVRERHEREKLLESVDIWKDFVVFYQPKVDIRDGKIVGAEALVRFKDPTDGGAIKSPFYFVPYYEQTGKITELDFFVYESVCKLLRKRMDEGLPVVTISCNFSRMHFMKPGFADHFEMILEKYGISKELIEVEITETLVVEEMQHQDVKSAFEELNERGIHLSIDDFGAGYSSLGIFEQIPASVVKMDRSFLLNQNNPERQVKIMRGIVKLSDELKAQVVCEGVETEKDVALMKEIGAYVAQGYYYSKPVPEYEFEEKLGLGFLSK